MKALLIGILYAAMRKYIGGGVFDRIKEAVETVSDRSIPGAQKRELVLDALTAEARQLGTNAVSAALEVILLKIRA